MLVKRDITCVVSEKGKDLQETDNNRRQSEKSRTVPLSDFRKTTNRKEKPQQAEVIAVGPGGVVDGKEVSMQVKVGDKVIYSKYSGTEVEVEDEKYVVVKQNDILAVIE